MNKEWIDFKKTFTKEQEDAIWQYFVDHANPQEDGFLKIKIGVRDVNDFWRRVHARYVGDFSRYNKMETERQRQGAALVVSQALQQRNERITREIDKNGGWVDKFILWLHRRTREKLYGENPSKLIKEKGIVGAVMEMNQK